jgi:hypothetical protein
MRTINRLVLFPEHYPGYFAVMLVGADKEYLIRRGPFLPIGVRLYAIITEHGSAVQMDARTINELIDKLSRRFGETVVVEDGDFSVPEWTLFDGEEPARPERICQCGCGAPIPWNHQARHQKWATKACANNYHRHIAAAGRRLAA